MDIEKRRENVKAWKEKNPDKVKAQKSRYYQLHAEECKARQKAYYASLTPEQKKARAARAKELRSKHEIKET